MMVTAVIPAQAGTQFSRFGTARHLGPGLRRGDMKCASKEVNS